MHNVSGKCVDSASSQVGILREACQMQRSSGYFAGGIMCPFDEVNLVHRASKGRL